MFSVSGWNLPAAPVAQKVESKKRKVPESTIPTYVHANTPKKIKHGKTGSKSIVSVKSDKPSKDKSKYMPEYTKKSNSGTNSVAIGVRRPRSPSPEATKLPDKDQVQQTMTKSALKKQKERERREERESRPEKAPLARPPRTERSSTPPKLLSQVPPPPVLIQSKVKLTPLQQKMADRLAGARFRWINEKLYTSTGTEALSLISQKPEMFEEYHQGFRKQVESWPLNPIEIYKARLENMISEKKKESVRVSTPTVATHSGPKTGVKSAKHEAGQVGKGLGSGSGPVRVADLGCGEAMLAHRVVELDPNSTFVKMMSFDLLAANERITACDISDLPLQDSSIDVAIFCLSLMSTDFLRFLKEASRVLRPGGQLWISEIKSRFNDNAPLVAAQAKRRVSKTDGKHEQESHGKNRGGVEEFSRVLKNIGFEECSRDESNKMFIQMDFVKTSIGKSAEKKLKKKNRKKKGKDNRNEETESAEEAEQDTDHDDDMAFEIDMKKVGALLKPCNYKRR